MVFRLHKNALFREGGRDRGRAPPPSLTRCLVGRGMPCCHASPLSGSNHHNYDKKEDGGGGEIGAGGEGGRGGGGGGGMVSWVIKCDMADVIGDLWG